MQSKIIGVAIGKKHVLAWDITGDLYSWGDATEGRLGHSFKNGGFNESQMVMIP